MDPKDEIFQIKTEIKLIILVIIFSAYVRIYKEIRRLHPIIDYSLKLIDFVDMDPTTNRAINSFRIIEFNQT